MMVITPRLLGAFEQRTMQVFLEEMTRHCQREFPSECGRLSPTQLRTAITSAVDRAANHGFTLRGPIRLFLELTFMLGHAFDSDPQYPWARASLVEDEPEEDRAEALFEQASRYADEVECDQNAQLVVALAEQLTALDSPFTGDVPADPEALLRLLHHADAAKARHAGNAALRSLSMSAIERAQSPYQMATASEVGALLTAMFFLGHRCDEDPLYPWLRPLFQDRRNHSGLASQLAQKTRQWFQEAGSDTANSAELEAAPWPQ